jgi:V-type H+-transporting ATPase subunit a
MERKLRFLETEIKKDELPIYDPEDNPDAPKPREMIDLEVYKYFFFLYLEVK